MRLLRLALKEMSNFDYRRVEIAAVAALLRNDFTLCPLVTDRCIQLRFVFFKKLCLAGRTFLFMRFYAEVFTCLGCDFSAAFGSA